MAPPGARRLRAEAHRPARGWRARSAAALQPEALRPGAPRPGAHAAGAGGRAGTLVPRARPGEGHRVLRARHEPGLSAAAVDAIHPGRRALHGGIAAQVPLAVAGSPAADAIAALTRAETGV